MSYEKMNALGRWIALSRYTREEFAKEMGVSYPLLLNWCGKGGVGKTHAEKVSKATGIPIDRLVVRPDKPLKWGGCWLEYPNHSTFTIARLLRGLFCAHAVTKKSRLQNSVTVFVTANPLIYNDILAKNRGLQKLQDFLNNYWY